MIHDSKNTTENIWAEHFPIGSSISLDELNGGLVSIGGVNFKYFMEPQEEEEKKEGEKAIEYLGKGDESFLMSLRRTRIVVVLLFKEQPVKFKKEIKKLKAASLILETVG